MTDFRKFASTAALSALIATFGLGAMPASADEGRGLFIGFASGVVFGTVFAHQSYRHDAFGRETACHFGHARMGWREQCRPAGYAVNYCWHEHASYRPVVCD